MRDLVLHRSGKRPSDDAARAVADQRDGAGTALHPAPQLCLRFEAAALRAACVHGDVGADRAIADAREPISKRLQVEVVREHARQDDDEAAITARHSEPVEHRVAEQSAQLEEGTRLALDSWVAFCNHASNVAGSGAYPVRWR